MGKQRYWGGHGRTATASTRRLKNNNPNPSFDEASSTSAGCMCAVFQLFDFHPLNQHHQPPQTPVSLKPISPPLDEHISAGTEAPRNSLESDEEESPLSCSPPKQKEDDLQLHFPKGIVQIKTKSSEMEGSSPNNKENNHISGNYSPSTKTPTLVARLMGLDLLPQSNSPSTTPRTASTSSPIIYPILQRPKTLSNNNHLMGSRSLPETPRTSCERKSNVENNYHHRLSLQIANYDKENASPSHYAKEIVKQIKETVSRKAGLNDITNYPRRDQEMIVQTKPKKVLSSSSSSSSSSSLSPRLKVLEPKNLNKVSPKVEVTKPKQKVKTKVALKKGNKQEEPFVVPSKITKAVIDSPLKKTKKTPLSNELLSFGSVPTVLMKKESPFFSHIKPSPLQSPCNRNQAADQTVDKESNRYFQSSNHQPHIIHHHQHVIQLPTNNNNNKDATNPEHQMTTTTATAAADCRNNKDVMAELEYVRQILLRRTTSSSLHSSFSRENNVSISHRKLLCHLVEELLKPYVEIRPYRRQEAAAERWPEVVEKLCEKVKKLPRAKCEVLEDIDGIIEKDLDNLGIGFEEESGGIVKEIEEWIVEELLKETVRFAEKVQDGVVSRVETEMAGASRGIFTWEMPLGRWGPT